MFEGERGSVEESVVLESRRLIHVFTGSCHAIRALSEYPNIRVPIFPSIASFICALLSRLEKAFFPESMTLAISSLKLSGSLHVLIVFSAYY